MAKTPTQVGRGNPDSPTGVVLSGFAGFFGLDFTGTGDKNEYTTTVTYTIPGPTATVALAVSNGGTASGDINVDLAPNAVPSSDAGFAAAAAAAINADSRYTAAVSAGDDSLVVVTNATAGPLVGNFVNSTPALVFTLFNRGELPGLRPEVDYNFQGPFSNVAPDKGIIQALARAAMPYATFLAGYSVLTGSNGIDTLVNDLRASLLTSFPANIIPGKTRSNVSANITADRKISIGGSRRDANGFAGRLGRNLNFTFTNENAERSLRQLIIRVFDSFREFIALVDGSEAQEGNFDSTRLVAAALTSDFSVEIGELRNAIGKPGIIYDNVVVDKSSDQGMLIYADNLADIVNNLAPSGDLYSTFRTDVQRATTNAPSGLDTLKLKN